jgi:hypothetical protein
MRGGWASQDLHAKMSTLLWDPMATRAFKDYLATVGAAELLLFFLEVRIFLEILLYYYHISDINTRRSEGAQRGCIGCSLPVGSLGLRRKGSRPFTTVARRMRFKSVRTP